MRPARVIKGAAVGIVWTASIAVGTGALLRYENAPGEREDPPAFWPHESSLKPPSARPALLMFVHPHCPCSRSSLRELSRLLTRCGEAVDAQVVFYRPDGTAPEWAESDLQDLARRLRGVSVVADEGGREAERFHARTSGVVVVYDRNGRQQFCGGITASRGHDGGNVGRDAIEAFLIRNELIVSATPVFGCALQTPEDCDDQELRVSVANTTCCEVVR